MTQSRSSPQARRELCGSLGGLREAAFCSVLCCWGSATAGGPASATAARAGKPEAACAGSGHALPNGLQPASTPP
jgi:hypothetical protein